MVINSLIPQWLITLSYRVLCKHNTTNGEICPTLELVWFGLTLFEKQVINVLFTSKRPNTSFHARAARALDQIDTETCVSMAVQCSFQLAENCAPQNMNLKTRTFKPTTHQNMSGGPMCFLMPGQPQPSKHITSKRVTMFWSHPPMFHVPPCNPHPCPMTHP